MGLCGSILHPGAGERRCLHRLGSSATPASVKRLLWFGGWGDFCMTSKQSLSYNEYASSYSIFFFCFLYRKLNSTGIQRRWDSFMALFSGVTSWHKFQEGSSQTNWLLTGKKTIIKRIELYSLMPVLHCLNDDYQNSELMCFRNTHLKVNVQYLCL